MLGVFFKSLFILAASVSGIIGFGVGIIKAIEYIEDKAYAAKKHIEKIIQVSALLHIILLFRGVSILQILFSLTIQYSFFCLLEAYPTIKMENPFFVYGSVASLINHFLVIRFLFTSKIRILEIVFHFLLIWITPFCFFVSLSANDEVLIVSGDRKINNTFIGKILREYVYKK